jgi:type IV pilus assembly protein PilA
MTLVQKTLKNQKGLTLIELLAVIVILGIIAAIAVPAIGNVIANSKEKAYYAEALNVISAAKIAQASGATHDKITTTGTTAWKAEKEALDTYVQVDTGKFTYSEVEWTSTGWVIKGLGGANKPTTLMTGVTYGAGDSLTETDLAKLTNK